MKLTDLVWIAAAGIAAYFIGMKLFARTPANDPTLDAYFKSQEDLFK